MLRPIALLLLATLWAPTPLNSCGWSVMGEEYRFWWLLPQLAETRELRAFHFSTEVLAPYDDSDVLGNTYARNLAEWQAIVGRNVPEEAIEAILYGTDPVDFFKHEEELFRSNTFLKRIAAMGQGWPAFIRYAKRCEQLVNHNDPWGFTDFDHEGIRKAWDEGQVMLRLARSPELKARIAYQLVRLALYGEGIGYTRLSAQQVYARHLAPLKGKTWLEGSAAFYLASMQPLPQRDLAFAALLDRAPDKQFRMVQLFVSRETEHYLPLAKDDRHRAQLLVMRCLQHPGRALDELERIAAWDPGNRHLPMLLGREVHKLEDWILTTSLTDMGAAIRQWQGVEDGLTEADVLRADLEYLHRVKAFMARLAADAPAAQRPLFTLMQGHLELVGGEFAQAQKTLARVADDAQAAPLVRVQARMDRILAGVMASHRLTDATRNEVLSVVALLNTEEELRAERNELLGQLHLYLGQKLIDRGEMPEGLFLLARSNRLFGTTGSYWSTNARHVAFERADPGTYDAMIALLEKKGKTPFERYLTGTDERPADWERTEVHFQGTELTREKLLDYKGMWYLRENRLEEAVLTYRQIPDDFWTGYPYAMFADDDPFRLNIHDPYNHSKSDSGRYNKRTIVERMIHLQREADRDPKARALNHYLLGNAYYNMSWHGKYWIMSRIAWSMHDMNGLRGNGSGAPGDDDYFGCARAREHYLKAIDTKDPVLKAMAVRNAARCEWNWQTYINKGEPDWGTWQNPYKNRLTSKKSQEAYWDILECRGYEDFVARYR
jgi:hypothetical protein